MMRSLLLVFLTALPLLGQAPDSLAAIQRDAALLKLERTEAYLKANTNAPDRLAAVNLVLESLQTLKRFDRMEPYLMARYEIYAAAKGTPVASNPRSVVTATAAPLYSLMMQQKRIGEAAAFKKRANEDWAGVYDKELAAAWTQIDRQFAMPKVGSKLGEIAFTDVLTGRAVSTKAHQGEVILLEFWISKCDICKAQRFYTRQAIEGYGPRGLTVMGFSQDEDEAVLKAYLESEKIDWPQCRDLDPKHRFAQKLNLVGVPTNFLLDQTGTIVGINLRDDKLLEEIDKLFK